MEIRRRMVIVLASIAVLTALALYPREKTPLRADLLSHGYSYGTGGAANCPNGLTLGVSAHKVVHGSPVTLGGALTTEPGFSVANRTIQFFQAVFTATSFTMISPVNTNSAGGYAKVGWPSLNATYKTRWAGLPGPPLACPEVNSGRATVLVYNRVPWVFGSQPRARQAVLIRGSVRPLHPGQMVHFMYKRLDDTRFRFARFTLDNNSNFFVNFIFDRPGRWYLRVSHFDTDPFHEGNYNAKIFNVL